MSIPSHQRLFNRRHFLQATGSATALLVVSACTSATPPSPSPSADALIPAGPQRGGILRIAMPDAVTQLDPALCFSVTDINLAFLTYDTLTRLDERDAADPVKPHLAETWELSADGLSYTFHLRTGVTFQHGTPLTAKDVAYTFQRLLDPALGSSVSATLHFLDRVVAVDEQIVEFQLKTPNVILPSTLANFFFSIVPHDRTSEQLSQQSAGSGPFQLAEQVPGERAVLKRNPQYWHPEQPYLDEVQLLTITEATSQIAALTSGTVDMVAQVGLEQLPVLEPNAEIKLIENQGLAHLFVMRVTDKPFDDVRVRQAFKHAVDRPALQQLILQGHGQPGNDQPVSPHSPYWANVPPLAYDIEKAKQLLADAGYADGVAVTLTVTDLTPRIVDAAVALQEMVKPAGINITLEKTSMDVYLSEKYGQTPFYVDWVPLPLEPDNVLTLSFGREAPFNLSGWSDDRVDELVNNARQEREPAKRKQMYGEVQQRISQEGAVLIPYFAPGWIATRTHVQGIIPSNFIRAESIWLSPNN